MRPDVYLFLQLFAGILVSVVDASVFCFGLFSGALSLPPFNLSTSDVNTISTAGTILSYFSLPIGVLYDKTSPAVTLAFGAVVSAIGWALMYAVFASPITGVAAIAACYSVSQFASSCFETASIFCNLVAFSQHEGTVVMLQKTFIGLGTSVIACIFTAFFAQIEIRFFFVFLAALGLGLGGFGAAILKVPSRGHEWLLVDGLNQGPLEAASTYRLPFLFGRIVLAANVIFLFSGDLYSAVKQESFPMEQAFGYVSIVLVLAFGAMPLVVYFFTSTSDADGRDPAAPLMNTVAVRNDGPLKPSVVRNHDTILKNVQRRELWMLWIIAFGSIGATVMVTSNVPQLYAAAVGPKNMKSTTPAILVSLFGIGSAFGRITIGHFTPRLLQSGRQVWRLLFISPLINTIALPLFLTSGNIIYLPMFLIGLGSGASWATIVLNIKRLFSNDGQHYNYLYTAGMVAPLIFNNWLFAKTYDHESRAQDQPNLGVCDGRTCVLLPLLVCAAVNLIAVGVSVLLNRRLDGGHLFTSDLGNEPEEGQAPSSDQV